MKHRLFIHHRTILAVAAIASVCTMVGVSMAQDESGKLPPKTLSTAGPELDAPKANIKRAAKRVTLGSGKKATKGTPVVLGTVIGQPATDSKAIRRDHGVNLSKVQKAFSGQFNNFHTRNGLPQLVTYADNTLTYHSGTHRVSRLKDIQLAPKKAIKTLGLTNIKQPLSSITLINDDTTQLLALRTVQNKRGDTLYKMTLYKVFGRYFGKAFDHTVGVKLAGKKRIQPTAQVEFVQGKAHIDVRLTPITQSGKVLTSSVQTHTYHPWEGIYRVPNRVPTSPKQKRSAMKTN